MKTSLALVHHANQYLITDGYDNREGIAAVVGGKGANSGLACALEFHERFGIPLNLHISGTLLEAIAWHQPAFLSQLRALVKTGLVELIGSSYGQNIMRFFGSEYNRRQLNEELWLYQTHLGLDPLQVKAFWPPERVWETRRMAPMLRDAALLNDGYKYVILDDRLLLSPRDPEMSRQVYDEKNLWNPDLYQMHEIEAGIGLSAFPIATRLRRSIPPKEEDDWRQVQAELEALLVHAVEGESEKPLLAVYADDMEKVSGIGEWGGDGPDRYLHFLEWLAAAQWIQPVLLTKWALSNACPGKRVVERGTFAELANDFNAGEGYEKWYLAPDWAPYRGYFNWAETRVNEAVEAGADAGLLELAAKQLLVGNWETAWHTPKSGPHGDPEHNGHASPWARALTSHSRHAAVTAEAARWLSANDRPAMAATCDIDNDGEDEIVLKSEQLFVVISNRWGGRVVSMFSAGSGRGAMVIGNPCDDWNWMEELNKFMEVPRNHPGAFADVGHENEQYEAEIVEASGQRAMVRLVNKEPESAAAGLVKEFTLDAGASALRVKYQLPPRLQHVSVECGLSPDYLTLLRSGANPLSAVREAGVRGFRANGFSVWLKPLSAGLRWEKPVQDRFGHGCMVRAGSGSREFEAELGVTVLAPAVSRPRRRIRQSVAA